MSQILKELESRLGIQSSLVDYPKVDWNSEDLKFHVPDYINNFSITRSDKQFLCSEVNEHTNYCSTDNCEEVSAEDRYGDYPIIQQWVQELEVVKDTTKNTKVKSSARRILSYIESVTPSNWDDVKYRKVERAVSELANYIRNSRTK